MSSSILIDGGNHNASGPASSIDVDGMLTQLLLFDQVVVNSGRLRDILALETTLGDDGLLHLLRSGRLRFYCDPGLMGLLNEDGVPASRGRSGTYVFGPFDMPLIRAGKPEHYREGVIEGLRRDLQTAGRKRDKIIELSLARWFPHNPDAGGVSHRETQANFDRHPSLVSTSILLAAAHAGIATLSPGTDIAISVRRNATNAVMVETSLPRVAGLDQEAARRAISAGLLGVGALNDRLDLMRRLNCVTGFRDSEETLLLERMGTIAKQLLPSATSPRTQLTRVLTQLGWRFQIPQTTDGRIDVVQLLDLTGSEDAKAFRRWLRENRDRTDNEIRDELTSLSARIGVTFHSSGGKVMRFLASTAAGFAPGIGIILSATLGLLDTFILDRLLKKNGVVAFMRDGYGSLFDKNSQ